GALGGDDYGRIAAGASARIAGVHRYEGSEGTAEGIGQGGTESVSDGAGKGGAEALRAVMDRFTNGRRDEGHVVRETQSGNCRRAASRLRGDRGDTPYLAHGSGAGRQEACCGETCRSRSQRRD